VLVAHAFIVANGTGASSVTVSDTRRRKHQPLICRERDTFVINSSRFRVRV